MSRYNVRSFIAAWDDAKKWKVFILNIFHHVRVFTYA